MSPERHQGLVAKSKSDFSEALLFGRLWYGEPNSVCNAIGYAKFYSRSHECVIRVFDAAGLHDSSFTLSVYRPAGWLQTAPHWKNAI